MGHPLALTCFMLADRLNMDVRDIWEWPVDLIDYWVAYCEIAQEMVDKKTGS